MLEAEQDGLVHYVARCRFAIAYLGQHWNSCCYKVLLSRVRSPLTVCQWAKVLYALLCCIGLGLQHPVEILCTLHVDFYL